MNENTNYDLKALYRKLLRKFHPDMTTDPERKIEYGELTKGIIDAYKNSDFDALKLIEIMGLAYHSPNPPDTSADVDYSPPHSVWRRVRESVWWALLNPYGLSGALREWNHNGRFYNSVALAGGVAWTWLVIEIWIGIGDLSRWLQQAGFSHEGPVGFALVVVRGVLILGAFRVVVPVAIVAFQCGLVMAVGVVACWVASVVLGAFTPISRRL